MRKEKMNNKGFSLVELIIVIAIMAILVVILAPQYLKYVERSRNSTDYQNATSIVNALQIYAADPDVNGVNFTAGQVITITVAQNGAPNVAPQDAVVNAAMTNAGLDFGQIQCVSRTAWTQYNIRITPGNDGELRFAYWSNNPDGGDDDFAIHMGTPDGQATVHDNP